MKAIRISPREAATVAAILFTAVIFDFLRPLLWLYVVLIIAWITKCIARMDSDD